MSAIVSRIAHELGVREAQVQAAVDLLDGGATVPFVARYRKEATGGLDDVALREIDTRLTYLREMQERCASILAAIEEQGKLTPELRQALPIIEWAVERANLSGVQAEQYHPRTGAPISVSPLTWSHSTFVIVCVEYMQRFDLIRSEQKQTKTQEPGI